MLDIEKVLTDERTCRALTGQSISSIYNLLPMFEEALISFKSNKEDRKRAIGAGQKGKLPTTKAKLVFILIYLKVYPTYDLFGVLTNRSRSKCCEPVKQLLPILEQALGKSCVLPKRKIRSLSEFNSSFGDLKDIFIDGAERPVQRPKNTKKQRKLYSGKKKNHTRKNIVACDHGRKILFLSPTKSGRRHDKKLLDKSEFIDNISPDTCIWGDTGFKGIQDKHANTLIPHKRSKSNKLTESQKSENIIISSFRVVVEHAIGGIKRYGAARDIYRNKIDNLDDKFHLLSAGLWNFHLLNNTK